MMTVHSQAQIRLLTPADAAHYREVRLEGLQQHPEAFGSTFERESQQPLPWFIERMAKGDIFGAFMAGELFGVAGFRIEEGLKEGHKGWLWGMYVRAAAQKSGLGRRLVEAVLSHAARHVEQLKLTVVSENEIARRLYAGLGFVEYGREQRSLKQDGRYYDEILMVKFLAAP